MAINYKTMLRRLIRGALVILALIPFIFWQPFSLHFKVYLTGTVINGIITREWRMVVFSIILFAAFLIPLNYRRRAKWANYGIAGAFFVSLFIEMYGIPLTILFASKYFFTSGQILPRNIIEFNFLGVGLGMDHAMVYGAVLMAIGAGLIFFGWLSLYRQSKRPGFARAGLYRLSRHPQYFGFILLVAGWWFGWPTILTFIFSPILVYKYLRAAQAEERDMAGRYGDEYLAYRQETPFLI